MRAWVLASGNSANEANLAAIFLSSFLYSFHATFSFLQSSSLLFFPFFTFVRISRYYSPDFYAIREREVFEECEFSYGTTLHRFETTSRSLIEDVDRALIEDVVGLLCKDFDLAKRARGDALRALVTSRAESSRGP